MKTRQLLLIFTLLLPIGTWADEYTDLATNVIYTYTVGSGVASVKAGASREAAGSPYVTGDITILSSFNVDENDYSVTSIGDYAFYGCSGLTSVTIPSGVTSIGSEAFVNSGWYQNQPDGLVYLDNWLIGNKNASLTGNITIADGTKGIAETALANYTSLESVTLPNSLLYIGDGAFYMCMSLTSVTIPSNVMSIGVSAFSGCPRLNSSITMMCNPTIGTSAFPAGRTLIQNLTANAVGDDKWLTYYNDYANFQADENTTVYKGSVNNGTVTLTPIEDKIVKAGEAVLLKSTSETIVMTSTTTASADDYADNELRGLNARTATSSILTGDLSGGTIYVLGNQNSHFGFHEYTGEYMAANKAFLALPSSSSGSRRLSIVFRNGETGVEMPISETEGAGADDWYTLDGRKLVAEPTVPGVYVNQGKKVIVK